MEDFIRHQRVLLAAITLFLAILAGKAQDAEQFKAERYIQQNKAQWAEAASKGDTAAVERILADDFVGVAPNGSFYDKAQRPQHHHRLEPRQQY